MLCSNEVTDWENSKKSFSACASVNKYRAGVRSSIFTSTLKFGCIVNVDERHTIKYHNTQPTDIREK